MHIAPTGLPARKSRTATLPSLGFPAPRADTGSLAVTTNNSNPHRQPAINAFDFSRCPFPSLPPPPPFQISHFM